MKGKIIEFYKKNYPSGTCSYTVVKDSKYGTFTGTVQLCEEDLQKLQSNDLSPSNLAGFRFAEDKVDIQILHAKARVLLHRAEGIKHVLSVASFNQSSCDEKMINMLKHQYDIAYKEYERTYKCYKELKDSFRDITDAYINYRIDKLSQQKEKHPEEE